MSHNPFLTALYKDVQQRLPLWTTQYVKPVSNGVLAVSSTWIDDSGANQRRLFIAVEASDSNCIDQAVLREWISLVEAWQRAHMEDEADESVLPFFISATPPPFLMQEIGDPSWRRACDLLAKHLQSLGQKITAIRRITSRRSSVEEIKRDREEVKRITRDANATDVQDIRKIVKSFERFILLDKSLSTEGRKLAKDAEMILKDYERTCNDFYRKCMDSESARGFQSSRALRAFRETSDGDDETEAQSLLNTESPQRVQFERDMYEQLMLERQRETGEVAEHVRDIHDIFQHINAMVHEQGEQLDIVENNLSSAERATRNASQHLHRAQQYQTTSSRNKMLFICMMIMLAIVSIGLLIS